MEEEKKGENVARYVVMKTRVFYYPPVDKNHKDKKPLVFKRKRTEELEREFLDWLEPMKNPTYPNRYNIQELRLRAVNRYIIGWEKEIAIERPARYSQQRIVEVVFYADGRGKHRQPRMNARGKDAIS